jgi:pimeloyl-ACP methyl ester carboxylesterase
VVVLPQRPGHGQTGGPYLEEQGDCAHADLARAGRGTADSIETALRYFRGQSAGGWGALAFQSRRPQGVAVVIVFAPGAAGVPTTG